jgi:hypothetical protein
MEYMNVDGLVYSRNAGTPPVINSELARRYGLRVPCMLEPSQYAGPNVGANVKLRLVVDGGKRKMTCHAQVDWLDTNPETGQCFVGFGSLSLSDEEFGILKHNFTDQPKESLQFGPSVRDKALEAETVKVSSEATEIMRLKAVNFPVSLIEAIDENRGKTTFSEFVAQAVKEYLKRV